MTVVVEQHIDARGADPAAAANLQASVARIKDETLAAVIQASNDGGAMAYATGRRRR